MEEVRLNNLKIEPLCEAALKDSAAHWKNVAKPLYSLGLLETDIIRIAGITGDANVALSKKGVLVYCADNGVVAEGVTQTDSSVTAAVADSMARGSSNINAMARVAGADVKTFDVGMITDLDTPGLERRKVRYGTGNIAKGPAMTREEAMQTIQTGIDSVGERKAKGYSILATGEMGIGNTTTSSALAAVLLNVEVERVTGRGAGLSDEGLTRKINAIRRAIEINRPDPDDALDALAKVGGLDIAAMAGAFLGGAIHRVPIVIDGFISSVAALVAARIDPRALEFAFASHVSKEPAGRMMLDALGLKPLICAEMSLGEGTGAVALFPLLDMALSVYHEDHTFESIQVDAYQDLSKKEQ